MRILVEVKDAELRESARRITGALNGVDVVFSLAAVPIEGPVPGRANGWRGAATRSRLQADPPLRKLVIGPLPRADALVSAVTGGTWAFVPPDVEAVESLLACAVEEIARGICPALRQVAADPAAASLLLTRLSATATGPASRPTALSNPLTALEVRILSFISRGYTSRRIADEMGFQLQTVKNKVTAILNKTGSRTRGQAVAVAQGNGWLAAS